MNRIDRKRRIVSSLKNRLNESNTRRRGLLTESDTYDNQLMTELVDLWNDLGLPGHSTTNAEGVGFHNVVVVMEEIKELGKEYGVRDLTNDLYRLGKVNANVWNRVFGKYQGSNGNRLGDIYNMFDMINYYEGGWEAFAKGNSDFTNDEFMDYYNDGTPGNHSDIGIMTYEDLDEYGYWDTWYGQVVGEHYDIL